MTPFPVGVTVTPAGSSGGPLTTTTPLKISHQPGAVKLVSNIGLAGIQVSIRIMPLQYTA